MARMETWLQQDLHKPVVARVLTGNLFSMDNEGNLIGVEVLDNGEAAEISGTVSANVIRSDGGTVAVTGTLSGNKASIVLPQAAYAVPGLVTIIIKLTSENVVTTLAAMTSIVYRTSTSTAVDPGTIIPSIQSLLTEISSAVNAVPADSYSKESVENDFEVVTGNRALVFNLGRYVAASTPAAGVSVSYAANATTTCVCAKSACEEGDVFTVHVYGYTGTNRAYFFCDGDMKIVSGGIASANTEVNGTVTAPAGSAYVVFTNVLSSLGSGYYAYKGTAVNNIARAAVCASNIITTTITSGSDLNDYTTPGNYRVINSTAAQGISNIPANNGGRLIVMALSGDSVIMQLYIPGSRQSTIYMRIYSSTWGAWKESSMSLDDCGSSVDMSTEIYNTLTTKKVCQLGAKDYYVTQINMPDNTELIGSGPGTRIILMDSVTTGAAIKMGSRCCIKDCTIIGSLTDLTFDTSGDIESIHIGTRHGILWLGDATESNSDANTHYNGSIENCWISGFTGGGITCQMTGYGTNAGVNAVNCHITNCGAGINIAYWSEFNRFTSVNCNECYYGVINNGGNNVFENCGMSSNYVGFYTNGDTDKAVKYDGTAATVKNGGHGSMIGGVINHSGMGDDSNHGYAIFYKTIDSGFVFTGLQIFYGKLWFRGGGFVNVTNVNFGNTVEITIYTGQILYVFANSFFRDNVAAYPFDTNGNPITTFNEDGNTDYIKFIDCYKLRGAKVTLQSIVGS